MTRTEKLRALLRERGVEYMTDDGEHVRATKWMHEVCECEYYEYDDGTTFTNITLRDAAPEKVVEATLGRGECRDLAETPRYGDKTEFRCSECGCEYSAVGGFGCDCGDEPSFDFCPFCGRKVVGE